MSRPIIFISVFSAIVCLSIFNMLSNSPNTEVQPPKSFLQTKNDFFHDVTEFDAALYESQDVISTYSEEIIKLSNPVQKAPEDNSESFFKQAKEMIKRETNNKELHFMVLGDFGYVDKSRTHPKQQQLSEFILNRVQRTLLTHDFFVSVGDNFYPAGLESPADEKADILFEDTLHMTELNLPWYSVLGNHDLMGDLPSVLNLNDRFPLWKQTELYYSKILNIGESHLKAAFLYLNSGDIVCLDPDNVECYEKTKKNVQFDGIYEQLEWLEDELTNMAKDKNIVWKIVVVHNAVFSAGQRHGDNSDLKRAVLPILEKHKVDLVLSGHDHSVQYLRMDLNEKMQELEEICSKEEIGEEFCSEKEFFHFELTKCGKKKPAAQVEGLYRDFALINGEGEEVERVSDALRESTVMKGDFLHQFVLGNGGIKHEKMCAVKQLRSEGKLRYGNSVSGVGEVRVREDRLEVELLSDGNELLYTLKIVRD